MEDSEKRKEMLKAMRMEAAAASQNDGSTELETSMNTGHLSNPLAEASTHQQESYDKPRFDYYTDPMAAYSSFKRNKSPKQQYISSPSHQMSPPVPQFPPSVPGACFFYIVRLFLLVVLLIVSQCFCLSFHFVLYSCEGK